MFLCRGMVEKLSRHCFGIRRTECEGKMKILFEGTLFLFRLVLSGSCTKLKRSLILVTSVYSSNDIFNAVAMYYRLTSVSSGNTTT